MHLTTPPKANATPTRARTTFLSYPDPRWCDAHIANGRRRGKTCGQRASMYDPIAKMNLCRVHASGVSTARPGNGASWYDLVCATEGHEDRRASAIGVDSVARCFTCSFDYEMAQPTPEAA